MSKSAVRAKAAPGRLVRSPLAWILLGAALLRLAYFLQVRADASFTVPIWDAAVFDEMGRSLAAGLGTGYPKAFFFGPLYPFFLGAVYALTGAGTGLVVLIQHALGVVLCYVTFRLGRHWFDRQTGLWAAALLALSGLQVFFEGTLLMEVLVSGLLAGQALLLVRLETRPSRWRSLVAGLLLGLASVGRPTLILLVPLAAFAVFRGRKQARRSGLALAALFVAGAVVAPSVTMVRNYAVEGVLVPITSSGGFNFYLGNAGHSGSMFFENRRIAVDSSWNGEDSAEAAAGRQLDSAEISRYWFGQALAAISAHPGRWLGNYISKVQLFLNGQDVPQIESYSHARRRAPILAVLPVRLHLLMALAVAGMAGAVVERRRALLLYFISGVLVLGTAAFFVTTRYRVVFLPYLCLFAAGYVMMVWRSWRGRTWKRLALLLAIGAAAVLFTLPARFPINERTREYAQFLHDGFKYAKAGQYSRALEAYDRARQVWPEDYESYLGTGIVHQSMDQLPRSVEALGTAMRLNTEDAEVPYHLGITLYKMNRFPAAEQSLRKSLEMNPRRALTHAYLGLALAAQGEFDRARQSFLTSLELDPAQAFTHSNYGTLLAMLGDRAQARIHLTRALALDPQYLPARKNLAYVYLDDGDPEAAARELRRVLDLAPGDREAREALESLTD